jgi:hypothetical protein
MMERYRTQFADSRPTATQTVPTAPTKLCTACAVGHHEQPILGDESCDCPCHGTPQESAGYRVAA